MGYQGVPEMLLPHKKVRGKAGEKAQALTPQQEGRKPCMRRRTRVPVEHGVRQVKAWRILRDEYRLAQGLFPMIALATVGLVHLSRIVT